MFCYPVPNDLILYKFPQIFADLFADGAEKCFKI